MRQNNEKSFTSYVNSPLGRMLGGLLDKIAELKATYPVDNASASAHSEAMTIITDLESLLDILHNAVLPQFDQGRKPDIFSLLVKHRNLYPLYEKNQWLFNIDDKGELTFPINHPMTYELALELARYINTAPAELGNLVEFLNPEALACNLHNGLIVGNAIKAALGMTVITQLLPMQNNRPDYSYEFIWNPGKAQETTKHNLSQYYSNYFHKGFSALLDKLQGYHNRFNLNDDLSNRLDETELVRQFKPVAEGLIRERIPVPAINLTPAENFDAEQGLSIVAAIDDEISRATQFEKTAKDLRRPLREIQQAPIALLLEAYYASQPAVAQENQARIPVQLMEPLADSDVVGLVALRAQLQTSIGEHFDMIGESVRSIQQHVQSLIEKKQEAVQHWLRTCSAETESYVAEIAALSQALNLAHDVIDNDVNENEVASLVQADENISQKRARIHALQENEAALSARLAQSAKVDDAFAQIRTVLPVQVQLTTVMEPAVQALRDFSENATRALSSLDKQSRALHDHLDKLRAEAAFAANMASANPDTIRALLEQKRQQLAQVSAEIDQIDAAALVLQPEIAERDRAITALDTRAADLQVQRLAIDGLNQPLITDALNLVTPLRPEAGVALQGLLSDKNTFMAWAEDQGTFLNGLIQERIVNAKSPEHYNAIILALTEVKAFFDRNEDTIPYYEVDQLESLNLPAHVGKLTGFKALLALLELAPDDVTKAVYFRSCVEAYMWYNRPSEEDVIANRQSLSLLIAQKMDQVTAQRDASLLNVEENQALQVSANNFSQIRDQVTENHNRRTPLIDEVNALALQRQDAAVVFAELRARAVQSEQTRQARLTDQASLQQSIPVFENIIVILEGLNRFHDSIESTDESMENLLAEQTRLEGLTAVLQQAIATAANPGDFTPVYTAITGVLVDTRLALRHKQDALQAALNVEAQDDNLLPLGAENILQEEMQPVVVNVGIVPVPGAPAVGVPLVNLRDIRFNLMDSLSVQLQNYEDNRQKRYQVKDAFSNNDRELRSAFIGELLMQMATFVNSGSSAELLKLIQDRKEEFPGIYLQSILNKITVQLMDYDSAPNQFQNAADFDADDAAFNALNDQALQILENLDRDVPQNLNYYNGVQNLYSKIDVMRNYGNSLSNQTHKDSILKLSKELRSDVNQFVIARQQPGHNDEVLYNQFKTKMTARLHSQDNVMNKLGGQAAKIIANIAAGVFTLGIAIGIRLLYSKIKYGHATFFNDKTPIQKTLDSLEKGVETVAAPAA